MQRTSAKLNKFSILLVIGLLIAPFNSQAQELEWSNTRKVIGRTAYARVIGENNSGLYMLRFRNQMLTKNVVIERYRSNLSFAHARNVQLKKARLLYAELQDTGLLFVTAHYDRKGTRNEVRCQWYDQNLDAMGKQRHVLSVGISDFYDKGDFRIRFSNNRKRILIAFTEKSDDDKRILNIHVFNERMDSLASHRYLLDIPYNNFFLTNLMVDNFGNAYFLINEHKFTIRRDRKRDDKSTVYWYNLKQDSLRDYQIIDSGKLLRKAIFTMDRQLNKVNLTAFYADEQSPNSDGLFHFHLWPNQPERSPKLVYQEFTDKFKKQLFGDSKSALYEDVKSFDLLRTLPGTDGGITIVAERSSVSNETDIQYINGMPTQTARNIYNFDDVLVISMDSNHQIKWKYLINKSQSSLNDNGYYSSVVIANTRAHLYIMYNDRLRTNGDVLQYKFTSDGKVTYKILVRSDNHYTSIIPSEAKQIAYNRVILPVTKDRKFSLLKLDYIN